MKKRSNYYWEQRANSRMASYHKNSDETIFKINKAYDKAIADINSDIKKIFNKYAIEYKLSKTEARQLLNSYIHAKDLKSIRDKIKYIQDEDLKKYLMAQLNYSPYKARITRLEALKESIYINTKLLSQEEFKLSTSDYIDNMKEAYYRNIFDIQKGIGLGFTFSEMPIDFIEEVLRNKWSGENYSKRIWNNTDVLAERLEEVITSGLMSGANSKKMAKELDDLSSYGKFASERLIRTETTYVTNMAEIESYKECDIEKCVFLATLDLRTSKICRSMDGKVLIVGKAKPGVNLPPLHPFCRSTTIAYLGKGTLETLQRRARDPVTGKNYIINNMNYNEWYEKFVVNKYGQGKTEVLEKMIKNKASDKKQYAKYKASLSELLPKNFNDFQKLKYNSPDIWSKIKDVYNRNYSESEFADIKSFFNKLLGSSNININIKQLPRKHYKNIMEYIDNSPDEVKKLVYENINEINFKDINFKDGAARYSPKEKGIYLDINTDFSNKRGQYTTVSHEMGHLIDHRLNNISIKDKRFRSLIIEDVNSFTNKYMKLNNIDNLYDLSNKLSEELKSDIKYHSISDLFGGVTDNAIVGKFKHSNEYWKNPKKLPKEAFAHFFEATLRNDEYKLKLIKEILPKSYSEFLKMLGDE
ncbi:minor capsid protein [Clostridium perfringens]|uniref:minor capsid protein n=1 Tax=Clostridium perfringens TaxID=1502 RepID=UPI001F5ACE3A|nr:minor capsid protein [Clostridium perfringens]MCI2779159.1 minor capsid protein [Clostridium perfringens]